MDDHDPSDIWPDGGLAKGTTFGQYEIVRRIGVGGMGEVYLATDTKLDRAVALKFLPESLRHDPEARQRLLREARAASKLNHKNVLTVYDVEDIGGRDFIVMEYIDGDSLESLIAAGTLTTAQIIRIALHVADGLQAAHQAGVIHRDIKPSNIIIARQGQAKIMDFGLATWRGAAKVTRDGATVGTPAYASPEQVQGREPDQRSDLFSFGAVLYQMITGQLPFGGEHEAAIVYSIVNEDPLPLAHYNPDARPGLQTIVSRALQKKPENRYQSAAGLLNDLKEEKRLFDSATGAPPVSGSHPSRKLRVGSPVVVIATVLAIVALMLILIKPWRVEVMPPQKAVTAAAASGDLIAVMYFENLAQPNDPDHLGEIAANLLITDLSESRYIKVVSSQRLYDILRMLGKEGEKVIDPGVATQIAQRAGARWMLTGSILQTAPRIVITTQLVDVATGTVINSQEMSAKPGMKIFDLVDELTVALKNELALPEEALSETDPRVEDLTTPSSDAYRFYLDGKESFYRHQFAGAEQSFRDALAIDSTFAMAYYGLSKIDVLAKNERVAAIEEAMKYLDGIPSEDREFILARNALLHGDYDRAVRGLQGIIARHPDEKEAYYALGRIYQMFSDIPRTETMFLKVIKIDSMFKEAYSVLAYMYQHLGGPENEEESIWAIDRYMGLAGDEPNSWVVRGGLDRLRGEVDDAIYSYQKALTVDSTYYPSLANLGDVYILDDDYANAKRMYQRLLTQENKNARALGLQGLALIPMQQGRFQEALSRFAYGIETDTLEESLRRAPATLLFLRASVYAQLEQYQLAIAGAEEAQRLLEADDPSSRFLKTVNLSIATLYQRDGQSAKADSLIAALRNNQEKADSTWPDAYWTGLGWYEIAKDDYAAAVKHFEQTVRISKTFAPQLGLARACYLDGRLGDAVTAYENAGKAYDWSRLEAGPLGVVFHYWLGMAYEKSGWNDKAVTQYETFLGIWSHADPGIPEVADARTRLKKLRNSSP